MSEKYQPKVGDRVRVTVECTVDYVKDADYFSADGWDFGLDDPCVSVEKVTPPLPTTPGSSISFKRSGSIYSLEPGGWRNTSCGWEVGQKDVRRMAERYGFVVLHDAGAAK